MVCFQIIEKEVYILRRSAKFKNGDSVKLSGKFVPAEVFFLLKIETGKRESKEFHYCWFVFAFMTVSFCFLASSFGIPDATEPRNITFRLLAIKTDILRDVNPTDIPG